MSAVTKSLETLDLFGFKTTGFVEAYSEKQRIYHGLSHMEFTLPFVDDLRDMYELSNVDYLNLMLAVWYHDKYYEPGAPYNELCSAQDAEKALGIDSPVPEMVLKTKRHAKPVTFLEGCLLDVDLCGLGYPWEVYSRNMQAIRLEFAMHSDEEWSEGRCRFLDKMLSRTTIFHTSWGGRYERFARRNMEREVMLLSGEERYEA